MAARLKLNLPRPTQQGSILSLFNRRKGPLIEPETKIRWQTIPSINNRAKIFIHRSFLTHAEQKKLFDHLMTDPRVKWKVGMYKDRELPRLLYAMSGKKERPTTHMDPIESKFTDEVKVTADQLPHLEYTNSEFGAWTEPVLELKERLEKLMNVKITYCELNQYRSGKDHIDWHSDRELASGNMILSISLGEVGRKFEMKPKVLKSTKGVKSDKAPKGVKVSYDLDPGCLMGMNYWAGNIDLLHRIVREINLIGIRICLTFRMEPC
jgi:alkylated DNA repair dioxygenase AlkB